MKTRRAHLTWTAALILAIPVAAQAAPGKKGAGVATPPPTLLFPTQLNQSGKPLRGIVDLHTHPMSHLGFGGKIVFGAPDVGLLLPPKTLGCNRRPRRARSVGEALGNCRNAHSGWNLFKNRCGSLVSKVVVSEMEKGLHAHSRHGVAGYPDFAHWPRYDDLTHQTMYVDWIKRAYQGGLRVLVTLAVNSYTLAKGARGRKPYDDKTVIDLQIDETIRLVKRHRWMEVAWSAADLRRIVAADKLAVIIGVETDDIGNWTRNRYQPLTSAQVTAELRRLHRKGVRYIFPAHLIDNRLTGAALYNKAFHIANKFHGGRFFDITCSAPGDGIGYRYQADRFQDRLVQWVGLGLNPFKKIPIPRCPAGTGHINRRGLTPIGRFAVREMMRLGMIVDIDHLSQRALREVFRIAEGVRGGYPLTSSHARIRPPTGADESGRKAEHYRRLIRLGGMAGIGWGHSEVTGHLASLRKALAATGGKGIALGTDFNGLVLQPSPPRQKLPTLYGGKVRRYRFGRKTWDYNRDGVAHYGLVPDFLRDLELKGGADVVNVLFDGAEAYARMWERAERVARNVAAGKAVTDPAMKKPLGRRIRDGLKSAANRVKRAVHRGARKVKSWFKRTAKKAKKALRSVGRKVKSWWRGVKSWFKRK